MLYGCSNIQDKYNVYMVTSADLLKLNEFGLPINV